MANPFHPLEVNSHTGEPFVRLPNPLENIIITPMRDSDKPKMIEYMNDWRIVQHLQVCIHFIDEGQLGLSVRGAPIPISSRAC